ncbi:MAG: squalene/phytoene synthase family protein [Comamonadaceae bacterium]|nr:squalene/phytoene synthase family protein [Comamonadaceae bacterium]
MPSGLSTPAPAHRPRRRRGRESPPVSVDHYENFPVASVLCPPRAAAGRRGDLPLRPHRRRHRRRGRRQPRPSAWPIWPTTATTCDAACRRRAAERALAARCSTRWPRAIARHRAAAGAAARPARRLRAGRAQPAPTPTARALLDYCRRSANPVGRLLLHLYGIDDARRAAPVRRDLHARCS